MALIVGIVSPLTYRESDTDKLIKVNHHNKEKSIRKAVIIWRGKYNPNYRKKVINMFIKKIECDKCTTR